jgi:WD40 repeat protein
MMADAEPPTNDHEDELQLALALSLSEAEAAAARPRPPRPASAASPRLPDDAWGVCADSLLPHELCCLARVSQGLKRAITSSRAYRYLRPFTLTGHAGAVLSVAVKPGGTIISGSADGWLKEWTVAGTQATCQDIVQQRARKIISVAALPDGRIVSGNQHSQLMLADTTHVGGQYGFPVGTMFPDTHGRSLYGVAARQDGSVVSVGLNDGDTGNWREDGLPSLKVWDVAEGRCRRSITVLGVPICLTVLPDGRVLMGCSTPRAGHIIVCDVTTNAIHYLQGVSLQQNHTGGVNAVASLPNERAVSASDDRTLKVWNLAGMIRLDLSNGRSALKAQCLHTLRGHRSSVLCVAGLPRDRIVSGSRDKTLRVWDVTEGLCLQTMRGHTGWVNCVGVLRDGRVVSGSRDKTLKVWGCIK